VGNSQQDLGCLVGWDDFVTASCVFCLLSGFSHEANKLRDIPEIADLVCGRALCLGRTAATFLWNRTLLKRFCKGLQIWMCRWVNGLTTWHNVYQTHLSCIPKTVPVLKGYP